MATDDVSPAIRKKSLAKSQGKWRKSMKRSGMSERFSSQVVHEADSRKPSNLLGGLTQFGKVDYGCILVNVRLHAGIEGEVVWTHHFKSEQVLSLQPTLFLLWLQKQGRERPEAQGMDLPEIPRL